MEDILEAYTQAFEYCAKMQHLARVRYFEVKYAPDGNILKLHLADPDKRSITSAINGRKGGRPCSPNAKPESIKRREQRRARKIGQT